VSITSWIEKKEQLQEKYGARQYNGQKHNGSHRHIIARIKRALTQNKLSNIKTAVCHLHNNLDYVPEVVNRLNALIGHRSLSFQWLPGDHSQSSALLIRNESIGLLVKTDPDSTPKGMMITPNKPAPFCSVTPETALSALSLQACHQNN
jgi:hypothetical protein